jgi:uncharacterized protein (DUF2236 family)
MMSGKSLIRLPRSVRSRLEASAHDLLNPPAGPRFDFSRPRGESALLAADSLSWRIFKNPVSLLIGGVAAVILELAEPAVRAGVWGHSSFSSDPMRRLQRTGLAAMVTVYGARSIAEPMIARVARLHSKVAGTTPGGLPYAASDARLLSWVQATATFGFGEAYSRYVDPLTREELSMLCRESLPASRLYGALEVPTSSVELQELFVAMRARLEPSPVIFEFLHIMRTMRGFPPPLTWMQKALVRAAVDLIPCGIRERLGLTDRFGLRKAERWLVKGVAAAADRLCLSRSPPAQACLRLGIPASRLYC